MKDERGENVFEVLEARAACASCIEKLEDPSKCPHVQLERPSWKSKEKQQVAAMPPRRSEAYLFYCQVVKALYTGNKMMMMRESLGVVTEGQDGIFLRKCVKHMFERERVPLPSNPQHVYIAIDPTGGGPSKFAIVSGIRCSGMLQVWYPGGPTVYTGCGQQSEM